MSLLYFILLIVSFKKARDFCLFSSLLSPPLPQTVPGTQLFNKWVNTPGSGSGSLVRAQKRKVELHRRRDGTGLWRKRRHGGEPRKQAPRDEGLPYVPQDFLSIWYMARPQQPLGNIVAMNTLSLDLRNLKKEWGKTNQSC